MANSVAFIGSSYMASEGEPAAVGSVRNRKRGHDDDESYTFNGYVQSDNYATRVDGDNFVKELSKQNPNFKIYNVSYPGAGIDTVPDRITYTEENYNPDLYCIEVPNYMRLTWHIDDRYLTEYENYYPLQIFESGKLLNPNKKYNRVPQVDSYWATLARDEQEQMVENHLFNLVPKPHILPVSRFFTTYSDSARMKQVISTLKLIHGYLTANGKLVKFYQWEKPLRNNKRDQFFHEFPESDKQFLKSNLVNETYFLKWANDKTPQLDKYMRPHDDAHLNHEGFKMFARYFDPIFNMTK